MATTDGPNETEPGVADESDEPSVSDEFEGEDTEFRGVLREVARADSRTPPIFLARGTPLGQYQIVELIGRGGMGVVYRAIDTRLDREVALKVLRGSVAANERRRRFFREARSAAAINHPNVATVYEVGEAGEHVFFAMELIEGQTLRRRLARGALGTAQAVSLVRDVALGLAAAHSKGIVHRDLKPENVMVTTSGFVKVLDFGLAKMRTTTSGRTPDDTLGHRETETLEGAVLGTPAYMAPEQASGAQVDARADVFALGIVLYELITGVRPGLLGKGPTIDDAQLAEVIYRCIATAPADRFADASEVLVALDARASAMSRLSSNPPLDGEIAGPESVRLRSTEPTPDAFSQPLGAAAKVRRLSWGAPALVVGILLCAFAVSRIARWPVRLVAQPLPSATAPIPVESTPRSLVEKRLTYYPPDVLVSSVAVSPDGHDYVYGDGDALWLAAVDGSISRRRVTLPPGQKRVPKTFKFFPDGKRLLAGEFAESDEQTWILPLSGGAPQRARDAQSFAMAPDGERIAFCQFGERLVVGPVMGGATTYIESIKSGTDAALSWSPDGRRIAIGRTLDEKCLIEVARADGSSRTTVATDEHCQVDVTTPVWTANDRVAFPSTLASGALELLEASIDENDAVVGAPRRLWSRPAAQMDTLQYRDGRFFYVRVESQRDVYVGRLDARQKMQKTPTRLTMSDNDDRVVGWMPDGRIVYSSEREGQSRVFVARLGEGGDLLSDTNMAAFAVLSDGDVMAFRGPADGGVGFVSRVKADGTSRDIFSAGTTRIEKGMVQRCAACARVGHRCVLGDLHGEEVSFSVFDPDSGERSPPFATMPVPNAWACSLSADGAKLFLPVMSEGLKIVDIATKTVRTLAAPHGGMIHSVSSWPPSKDLIGTGFELFDHDYGLIRFSQEGVPLEPLWTSDSLWMTGPIIAPNGRDIALTIRAFDTDVYMLEPADAK